MNLSEEIEDYYEKIANRLIGLDNNDFDAVYSMGVRSYLFVDILGTGTYSTVYKAVFTEERNALFPEEFAIKILKDMRYGNAVKREGMSCL